jgi:tetratricopeptide (TPR) repeat protein
MRNKLHGMALAVASAGVLLLPGCQPSGEEALVRGDRELQAGRPQEAIQHFELAASKLPTEGQVWNRLGLAYHAAGRLPDAQKAYLRALEFNRNLFDVRFNLGELLLELNQPREAEAEFRTYLNASTDNARNPDAWRGVGLALQAQRQYPNAEIALANATRLNPQDGDAWNALGLVRVQARKPREAYQAFQQAAQAAPELASARLNLAVTAQQSFNDRRAALGHYRDFLTLQSSGPEADSVRAVVEDLEIKLGLVRPPAPVTPTNPPPALVQTSRPPTVVTPPTNPPPTVAVRSNPPPRPPIVVTSPPPARAVVASNPPKPTVVVTTPPPKPVVVTPPSTESQKPKPPTTPPPTPVPEVPLEVVAVTNDPTPRRADDTVARPRPAGRLAVPIPETRPPETTVRVPEPTPPPVAVVTPAPTPEPAPDAAPTDADGANADSETDADGKPRRGFWGKVNPVRWGNPTKWFRKEGPAQAEVPDREAAKSTTARASTQVTPLPPAVPPKPVWSRYTRENPLAPARGNRAAADAEYQRGAQAHQKGDLKAAADAYRRAIALDPAHFESQHNLTLVALQQGDLKTSLSVGEVAVALDPDSANARYNLAVALQRSRYPVDAAEELEKLTRLHPDDPNAHLALATLCAGDLADPDCARTHYERVLALKPNHPQAENIRRWLDRHPR